MTTPLERALDSLTERVSSLRDARTAYPEQAGETLSAALAELDTALELLAEARKQLRQAPKQQSAKGGAQRELKLLRQVFRVFPVPVFVLDGGAVIRRINAETSRVLGSPDGYLVGRSFPLLVETSRRAAFRSHLTAVLQTGQSATFETRLSHQGRTHTVQIVLTRLTLAGEPQPLVAAVALPTEIQVHGYGAAAPAARPDAALLLAAARRQELLAEMARILLDEESLRRPVALARAARLLAADWADWVIADVVRDDVARRATVLAPKAEPVGELVRLVERAEPLAGPLVAQVMQQGTGVLHEMLDDEHVFGAHADGPLLTAMGAVSVMCVPIGPGEGALTLVRTHDRAPFTLGDLGLMEQVGVQLGLALRAQRSFQSSSRAAESLTASVVPRTIPETPGFEAAAIYHQGSSVGAEFYDVFPVSTGWGFALGGAAGKGEAAASVSAMVKGGLRVLSVWEKDPDQVVRRVNEAMVAQGGGMFVMALAGFVNGRRLTLSSAGHHPAALVSADGAVRFVSGGGVPLGIAPAAETASEELTMSSGETLVLYSDGLVSSRNERGEPFGEERLADVLGRHAGRPPATVAKAIEDERHAFSGGRVWDEIVILAFRPA
ncbi:SpoIIE family protein phosphatase [Nonomuraea sp. NPDC050790]|uniref:SpoIIE family protein phosphatase n=1 Tax=Nonomuraea sp. NPDC050790 TaxID=3364371 RepID=UPI0037B5C9D5